MKVISLLTALLCVGISVSAEDYRDFKSLDGKTVRGKVLRVDARKNSVTIERDNRKSATVPINVFSEADQKYIQEWMKFEGVRSTSKLKVECERRRVESWTEEILGTINYTGGGHETDQVVGKRSFEKIGYDVKLRNNNDYNLNGLTIQYCIYYEQDAGRGVKSGVISGSSELEELTSRKEAVVSTDPVQIHKLETNAEFLNSKVEKGEVEGVWIRICAKDENGGLMVLRQESLPSGIMKSKIWSDESQPAGHK